MDQEKINLAVQALWLQYKGLVIGSARSWHRIDNAAYKMSPPLSPEDLTVHGGHMIAT